MSTVTNVKTVRNFEVTSGTFYSHSVCI